MTVNLKNKPLIEAIFEIKWSPENSGQSVLDLNTQLMFGRLFDRINSTYPNYEQLSLAAIPELMADGIVKHRFKSEKGWPLVQLGTGILTLNDTENYVWEDFKPRIIDVIKNLIEVYPNKDKFQVQSMLLKYINAIDINSNENIYNFLKDKMKINLSLNNSFFENTSINNNPVHIDLRFAFDCERPKGVINFHIFKGQKLDNTGNTITDALIWETIIQSNGNNISDISEISLHLEQWLEEAHDVTHNWFFTLVEGDLLRSFE